MAFRPVSYTHLEETGPVKTEDAEVPAQEEELCGYPLAPEEVE